MYDEKNNIIVAKHPLTQNIVINFFLIPDLSAITPKIGLLKAIKNVPRAPVNAHTTVAEN